MLIDISVKKAEETIGKPIFWQIPNDTKLLTEARNQGVPLVQHSPKSKVHQSIQGLACALTGKQQQSAPKEKARWALFSRK